ncbi:MAG: GNAT family N-acetyltransferase [Chloroflexi bacterium]|nr:MAG: GNAT family N-acetyltransferase [Chloroflexota bacterium]
MPEVGIRRLRASGWPQLRELRLQALRDAPLAFGSTYQREAAHPDERWQQQAKSAELGGEQVAFVAVANDGSGDRHVGVARGYLDAGDGPDHRPVVWLVGVYVDPRWRGRGLARGLSAEVIAWAQERGAGEVLLHVAEWNATARRVYDSLGFTPTGATATLDHDATVSEAEMKLGL